MAASTPATVSSVAEAGADVIVAGAGIFKGGAYAENIAAIRHNAEQRPRRGLVFRNRTVMCLPGLPAFLANEWEGVKGRRAAWTLPSSER